jgi:hypothetical protein
VSLDFPEALLKCAKYFPCSRPILLNLAYRQDLIPDVKISCLLFLADNGDLEEGGKAYRTLLELLPHACFFDMIRLEAATHLMFRYPNESILPLLMYMDKLPTGEIQRHLKRVSILPILCDFHPQKAQLMTVTAIEMNLSALCKLSNDEKTIDLTAAPYRFCFSEGLARLIVQDSSAFANIIDQLMEACFRKMKANDPNQVFNAVMPILLNRLFKYANPSNFQEILVRINHFLSHHFSDPRMDAKTKNDRVGDFLARVAHSPYYQSIFEQVEQMESALSHLNSGNLIVYWTFLLRMTNISLPALVHTIQQTATTLGIFQAFERAIEAAFQMQDKTAAQLVLFIISRGFPNLYFVEEKRMKVLARLVPLLRRTGENLTEIKSEIMGLYSRHVKRLRLVERNFVLNLFEPQSDIPE